MQTAACGQQQLQRSQRMQGHQLQCLQQWQQQMLEQQQMRMLLLLRGPVLHA
jgi:hypothetical protein